MKNRAFIKLIIFHAADHPDFETEVQSLEVLAPTPAIQEWARNEVEMDEAPWLALLTKVPRPLGFYCVMCRIRLDSGKYDDTPNSPGETWGEVEPVGDILIDRITKSQDLDERIYNLYADKFDVIFKKESS